MITVSDNDNCVTSQAQQVTTVGAFSGTARVDIRHSPARQCETAAADLLLTLSWVGGGSNNIARNQCVKCCSYNIAILCQHITGCKSLYSRHELTCTRSWQVLGFRNQTSVLVRLLKYRGFGYWQLWQYSLNHKRHISVPWRSVRSCSLNCSSDRSRSTSFSSSASLRLFSSVCCSIAFNACCFCRLNSACAWL